MGIEYFTDFTKEIAPDGSLNFEVDLTEFSGKAIAVDFHGLMHMMMNVAANDVLNKTDLNQEKPDRDLMDQIALAKIMERLAVLLDHNITPVCVFDGSPHKFKKEGNPKKIEAKRKKSAAWQDIKKRMKEADFLLKPTLFNDYRKKYKVKIRNSFTERVEYLLTNIGIPIVKAADVTQIMSNDGEAICAALCLPGNDYCFAGYSKDSDFHVYGGNIQIKDIFFKDHVKNKEKIRTYKAEVRVLEHILIKSGLSFTSFRDLCIMLGNDFNTNIPRVGLKTNLKAIRDYQSFENTVWAKDANIRNNILKYDQTLAMFASAIQKLDFPPFYVDPNKFRANARELFGQFSLEVQFDKMLFAIDKMFPLVDNLADQLGEESLEKLLISLKK